MLWYGLPRRGDISCWLTEDIGENGAHDGIADGVDGLKDEQKTQTINASTPIRQR